MQQTGLDAEPCAASHCGSQSCCPPMAQPRPWRTQPSSSKVLRVTRPHPLKHRAPGSGLEEGHSASTSKGQSASVSKQKSDMCLQSTNSCKGLEGKANPPWYDPVVHVTSSPPMDVLFSLTTRSSSTNKESCSSTNCAPQEPQKAEVHSECVKRESYAQVSRFGVKNDLKPYWSKSGLRTRKSSPFWLKMTFEVFMNRYS